MDKNLYDLKLPPSKSQIAISLLTNIEDQKNISKKNNIILSNPSLKLFSQLQSDYLKIASHYPLQIDNKINIQLLPYNQQYYEIDMKDVIFPIELMVSQVKNQCQIYIGYDQKFPGLENSYRLKTQKQHSTIQSYHHIIKDLIILLRNQTKKQIKKIYLGIKAKNKMCKFNLIAHPILKLRNQKTIQEKRAERRSQRRVVTQTNSDSIANYLNKILGSKNLQSQRQQPKHNKIQKMPRINSLSRNTLLKQVFLKKSIQRQFDLSQKLITKSGTAQLNKIIKNNSLKNINKQKSIIKLQTVKNNKIAIEELKYKQKKFKQLSSVCQGFISGYQKEYKKNNQKKAKLNLLSTPLLYLLKFLSNSSKIYQAKEAALVRSWRVNYLVAKITRIFKRRHRLLLKQIPGIRRRLLMNIFETIKLTGKISYSYSMNKAVKNIFALYNNLFPSLLINCSFIIAEKYQNSVILIQKSWKIKYSSRLLMLKKYTQNHVDQMLIEFPHFVQIISKYKKQNICHIICYEYMTDQSIKYRHIYQAYINKIQQIEEYIQANKLIYNYNMKLSLKKSRKEKPKQYFDVPMRPNKPLHRFFRNLDVLKSMIRGWFQLEYKKQSKKVHRF